MYNRRFQYEHQQWCHIEPLLVNQGMSCSCSFVSVRLAQLFLNSPTPPQAEICKRIVEGEDIQHSLTSSSSYTSAPMVFKLMKECNLLSDVDIDEDITGINAADSVPSSAFPPAFLTADFGMHKTLRDGLQKLWVLAAKLEDGQTIAATLSTAGHTVAIAYTLFAANLAPRYTVIQSLKTNPITGIGGGPNAVIVTSDLDIGITSYLEALFPPVSDVANIRKALSGMDELATGATHMLYSITVFKLARSAITNNSILESDGLINCVSSVKI